MGEVKINSNEIEDFAILRSNGEPTYHCTVVIDDHLMNINLVVRSLEHYINTFKQLLLYNSFTWDEQEFLHLPLVLNTERKKLSKRHQSISMEHLFSGYISRCYMELYNAFRLW